MVNPSGAADFCGAGHFPDLPGGPPTSLVGGVGLGGYQETVKAWRVRADRWAQGRV
jgi:hypothetical protein